MNVLRLATGILLIVSGAQAASGEEGGSPGATADVGGAWSWETKVFDGICRMTGELELAPTPAAGEYVGRLNAHQRCGDDSVGYFDIFAEQTVRAVRAGDSLTITSTIERLDPADVAYAPDNFELTIVDSALMVGELHGFRIIPSRFVRGRGAIA